MQASVLRGSSSNLRYFMPILRTWGPKLSMFLRGHIVGIVGAGTYAAGT